MCAKKLRTTTTTKTTITYDINLDIRILNAITFEKDSTISISNLRNYLEIHSTRLEEHIQQLVKWNMITDKKPDRNGKARIISLSRPSLKCYWELIQIKDAIDKVNEYFSK